MEIWSTNYWTPQEVPLNAFQSSHHSFRDSKKGKVISRNAWKGTLQQGESTTLKQIKPLLAWKLLIHPLKDQIPNRGCFVQSTQRHTQVDHRQTFHPILKDISQRLNVTHLPNKDNFTFPHIHFQTSKSLKTGQNQPNRKNLLSRGITEKNGIINK